MFSTKDIFFRYAGFVMYLFIQHCLFRGIRKTRPVCLRFLGYFAATGKRGSVNTGQFARGCEIVLPELYPHEKNAYIILNPLKKQPATGQEPPELHLQWSNPLWSTLEMCPQRSNPFRPTPEIYSGNLLCKVSVNNNC